MRLHDFFLRTIASFLIIQALPVELSYTGESSSLAKLLIRSEFYSNSSIDATSAKLTGVSASSTGPTAAVFYDNKNIFQKWWRSLGNKDDWKGAGQIAAKPFIWAGGIAGKTWHGVKCAWHVMKPWSSKFCPPS